MAWLCLRGKGTEIGGILLYAKFFGQQVRPEKSTEGTLGEHTGISEGLCKTDAQEFMNQLRVSNRSG
jgi:hypothetical protein